MLVEADDTVDVLSRRDELLAHSGVSSFGVNWLMPSSTVSRYCIEGPGTDVEHTDRKFVR